VDRSDRRQGHGSICCQGRSAPAISRCERDGCPADSQSPGGGGVRGVVTDHHHSDQAVRSTRENMRVPDVPGWASSESLFERRGSARFSATGPWRLQHGALEHPADFLRFALDMVWSDGHATLGEVSVGSKTASRLWQNARDAWRLPVAQDEYADHLGFGQREPPIGSVRRNWLPGFSLLHRARGYRGEGMFLCFSTLFPHLRHPGNRVCRRCDSPARLRICISCTVGAEAGRISHITERPPLK